MTALLPNKLFLVILFFNITEVISSQPVKVLNKINADDIHISISDTVRNLEKNEKKPVEENKRIILNCHSPQSDIYKNKYRLITTFIPQEDEAVKFININFNIFQDFEGKNNFQPAANPSDRERLLNMLAWINEIYAKQPWCEETQSFNSDPPMGVKVNDLPHKFIQFKLGGIYEYKDKTKEENLWKSNDSRLLLKRIAVTDSTRLNQLNICFTEKYYLGSLREIKIKNPGKNYEQPEVIVKDKKGKGAVLYAQTNSGVIKSIVVIEGGKGYSKEAEIVIKSPKGTGAEAKVIINEKTGSIARVEMISGGSNYNSTRIEIIGGNGFGASAYITKFKKGKIKEVKVVQRGNNYSDDPEIRIITDSKGNGAVLEPFLRGATGFTLTPSFADADMYIVEKTLWNYGNPAGDYAAATNIAHELGHVLDLLHTYGGGSETNKTDNPDYMWDLFGKTFSGYDIVNWGKNPCENPTDKVTNNLLGGNQTSQYTSPIQIGKMHRALHIYNVKKYTDCHCDTKKKWVIGKDELWDFPFKSYNPITISNGNKLTVACTLEMPDGCDIIVENGGTLVIAQTGIIKGGCGKAWNGSLFIRKGAQFSVEPGGKYVMQDLSRLIIE